MMASSCDNFELEDEILKLTGCEPGEDQPCHCGGDQEGFQICQQDGRSWGECICEGPRLPGCTPQTEVCDGLDNDCDGLIDENAIDATTWYRDEDDDGFGKEHAIVSCEATALYRAVKSGDCDDTNALINPNMIEQCDNADNNCDGRVDEGLIVTLYQDNDGDGYGTEPIYTGCAGPIGALKSGDCDDSENNIHPGAYEIECDGMDNDCDGVEDPGTFLDKKTGICWQDHPIDSITSFPTAWSYCASLNLGGFSDWTVPSISALRTLISACPAVEPGGFCPVDNESAPDVDFTLCDGCDMARGVGPGGCYWPAGLSGTCSYEYHSSTGIEVEGEEQNWRVYFAEASIGAPKPGDERALVRCARNDFE